MDAYVVIAKEPRGGSAKTRLQPRLGASGAADIAEAMLLDTLEAIAATAPVHARLVLFHDPPDAAARLRALVPDGPFEFLPQPPGTLGGRLAYATRHLLGEGCDVVIVIAADAPHVAGLAASARPAAPGEIVLGPCADGGYWAVGLDRPAPIFDVAMGDADVLDLTVDRARRAGRRVRLLQRCLDVDTPDDLAALAADGSLSRAPRTAAAWHSLVAAPPR